MKKKLFKTLICALLTAAVLCLATGCAIFNFFKSDGKAFAEHTYVNCDDFKFNYTQDEFDAYLETISDTYDAAINPKTSNLKFSLLITDLTMHRLRLVDSYHLARILYYADTTNQENYQAFIDIDTKYNTSTNEFNKLYEVVYKSPFKEDFYGEMTDEEIEELIRYRAPSDEKVALNNQITDIQTRFNALSRAEKLSPAFDGYYKELIDAQNALAVLNNFESFNEESYAVTYARDYTPQDTLYYTQLIKDELFGSIQSAVTSYNGLLGTINESQISEYNALLNTPFYTAEGKAILDGFYKTLGTEIYDAYTQLINEGYYYIAHSENAYQGAFTSYFSSISAPYMYFSASNPYYVSVNTFVHEFGHYLNFYFAGSNGDATYELMETHSQGAEWLFAAYLEDKVEKAGYDYIIGNKLQSDGYTIILSSLVGAFEVHAYENPLEDGKTYDDLMISIKNDVYGSGTLEGLFTGVMSPETYFRLVTIPNPSYYISYSVSLISSLELYALATNDYANAVDVYTKLLKMQNGYVESLNEVGLSSPFEAETYALISQVFSFLD